MIHVGSPEHIRPMQHHFEVEHLRDELDCHPECWNQFPMRTGADSPHRETDDIWVRYNAVSNWHGDMRQFNQPHEAVWYPVVDKLPSARQLAEMLQLVVGAHHMGGVLITRVPAGSEIYPHIDRGWHAEYYQKYIIQIAGTMDQAFCFTGAALAATPGECYWFDNSAAHWVKNPSDEDRISLIVCLR